MLRTTLTYFLLSSMMVFGQEEQKTTSEWQRKHPRVVCMELSDFAKLSEDKQNILKPNVLLFEGELKESDLQKYEDAHQQESASKIEILDDPSGQLKTWLYAHPDLKIISRSRYNAMSASTQEKHDLAGTLVLRGEVLTIKDVQYYEENN